MFLKFGLNCVGLHSLRCIQGYQSVKLCNNAELLKIASITSCNAYSSSRTLYIIKNHANSEDLITNFKIKLLQSSCNSNIGNIRFKSSKKKRGKEIEDSDDSDSEENEEWVLQKGKNFKDIKIKVPSLRLDAVVKAGFGLSRNKAEESFYGGKIKLNKAKPSKKSVMLGPDDFIDLSKPSESGAEPGISRVRMLKIGEYDEKSDRYTILIRKFPKLSKEEEEDA